MRQGINLVVVAGPTGAGKSDLAIHIARRFNGEILNCDSVQIYRYFDVGTAKLPEARRCGVAHHLIDFADPPEIFTAGDFARLGRPVLHGIAARAHLPVVTGGTGFYLRALLDGLTPGPARDPSLRARLREREERKPGSVHRLLSRLDRVSAARIHPRDAPKVIRALEISMIGHRPASDLFAAGRDRLEGFRVLKIVLFPDRDQLYAKLDARVDAMFAAGLVEETASILARGFPPASKPFESIGYKQALQILKGELSLKDGIFYTKRDTRRYSKRQMTWFRQDPGVEIYHGFGDDPAITSAVEKRTEEFLLP